MEPALREGDWVIVGDGKKALVLENIGDEKFLNLKTREVHEHPDLKTRELGTDAPGRAFNSVGAGRSAMEPTDCRLPSVCEATCPRLSPVTNPFDRSRSASRSAMRSMSRR